MRVYDIEHSKINATTIQIIARQLEILLKDLILSAYLLVQTNINLEKLYLIARYFHLEFFPCLCPTFSWVKFYLANFLPAVNVCIIIEPMATFLQCKCSWPWIKQNFCPAFVIEKERIKNSAVECE